MLDPLVPAQADRALVRRMAAGDEAALGELHDRFAPLLHSVVLRILGDADDAEEVLEETFWQAWRQAGRYEERRGGISTWLVMMARSRAVDRVRSRRRFREERWDELAEPAESGFDDGAAPVSPLDSAHDDEVRRVVARAVAGLPREQRQAVELAYFGGMSQTEIAQATGLPLGTVKTRARLALQKLREALSVLREDAP
ncbi:MAG TPA: sigma-70 family RNA polymerase sigma factor [Longimicrobium sp.]|nr:sigma-70 family RNA polymerase sigma factor [Longimicrobium sp.]